MGVLHDLALLLTSMSEKIRARHVLWRWQHEMALRVREELCRRAPRDVHQPDQRTERTGEKGVGEAYVPAAAFRLAGG